MSALIQAVPQVSAEPALRAVRVGLAGCGVVGSAFAELLRAQRQHIAARHGLRIDIAALLVRDTLRTREPIGEHVPVTADPARFLAAECDVVIECIGGIELPYRIAAGALLRGVPLVTANKALIAAHGVELHAAARAAGTRIGIEAAVAGGAPVIRTVTEALAHTGIVSMQGVLNGTTNFMLSQLAAGASFDAALCEAQRLGFAEADPSRDLSGRDAADKLAILAWLAFGVSPAALSIEPRGIDASVGRLSSTAAAAGGAVRLIAQAELTPAGVVAAVEPVIVDASSPFARISAEENLLRIATTHGGTVTVGGPGAGGSATAVSLLADVVRPFQLQPPAAVPDVAEDTRLHDWFVAVDPGRALILLQWAAARGVRVVPARQAGVFGIGQQPRRRMAALQRDAHGAGITLALLRHAPAASM